MFDDLTSMLAARFRAVSSIVSTAIRRPALSNWALHAWPRRLVSRRHGGVWLALLLAAGAGLCTRAALLAKAAGDVTWNASLLASFAWGALFDVAAALWWTMPLALALAALPARFFAYRWGRALAHAAVCALLFGLFFGATAEWLFWDEFGVRFNFIAVDYLVYTTEVLGNIRESYPLPAILAGGAIFAIAGTLALRRSGVLAAWLAHPGEPARQRWRMAAAWTFAAVAVGTLLHQDHLPRFANTYHAELAKNGLWSLFAAFRANELNYAQFYRTLPEQRAYARIEQELVEDGSILLRPGARDTIRYVHNAGPELRLNVVQITVESLSADFLSTFNRASKLTPNLEAIARESLVFDNFYATGTRTDRGMEALTLSLPPTPGRSLIKRPGNENLFTLGSVVRAKGYDTAFLYGGYGYFDNMNYFFRQNGYRVIDRGSVARDEITFANAWGACDEDLYRWTVREADAAHASGRPFHFFVMTTSNHRPFTYPEGRIDLPPKVSGRAGAVKYTDHAIGEFLRTAAQKPWFRQTIFVIVADHCASSAGRTELPVQNYHIPLLIYAPGGQIAPGHIRTLASQMDYAPTLLGLLNWSYPSRFYGHDVRRVTDDHAHALLGNYQKLGHVERDEFVVLAPRRGVNAYRLDLQGGRMEPVPAAASGEEAAIAFYQTASQAYRERTYRALEPAEYRRWSAEGERLALAGAVQAGAKAFVYARARVP